MVELKEEFTQFMANMSCLSMMKLRYPGRCLMSQKIKHCDSYTSLINYFELMYCVFKVRHPSTELAVLALYSLIYVLMFCFVYVGINEYYLPALKIAAIRFKMNEYLAGVILVGVANSTSDFLLNLSPVRSGSPTLNICMCAALTAICLSGGAICFIMPFKMNGSSVFRDFLFVLLLLVLIRLFMDSTIPPYWVKALIIFSIYPVYLAVNIIDLVLMRYNIRKLRREINVLKYQPSSPHLNKKLFDKVLTLTDLEVDDDVQLLRMKTRYGIFRAGVYVTPKPLVEPRKVDVENNRSALHSKNNPKNRFLLSEFLTELNPIDLEQWSLSGRFGRFKIICAAPVKFTLRLMIPRVNFEQIKHGWSKLLNCLQIIINPFFVITFLNTMYHSTHLTSWIITFYYEEAMWSFLVTVPLSAIVFHHSRTDIPPSYHFLFAFSTIISVITLVWVCAWEMEVIVSIIGIVFNLSSEFMTVTFNAFSNAMPDMIAYVRLSEKGYGKMAFGGIIGGIVFNLVCNLGTQFAVNEIYYAHLFGGYGQTLYVFLVLTICSTILWCFILDFNARRSGGIFLWCLYILFLLYVTLMEMNIIHDFTDDEVIPISG